MGDENGGNGGNEGNGGNGVTNDNTVVFFANRMDLKIENEATGSTEVTLAALHGCEIIAQAEHIEEYGMDSIKRIAVAKAKFKVEFKVKYAKFNPTVGSWWQMGIWKVTSAGTDGKVCDSNDVATFKATGTIDPGGSGTKMQIEVSGIYFPAMPLILAENQFIVHDLSGIGSDVVFTNPSS